jgi:hypothetical protein
MRGDTHRPTTQTVGAIALWLRSTVRGSVRSTLALALTAGLGAGVVGLGAQGARRSNDAIARYLRTGRTYDVAVTVCPPGIDASTVTEALDQRCGLDSARRFAAIARADSRVEAATVSLFGIVGIVGHTPTRSTRQSPGRWMVANADFGPDAARGGGRPIVVSGRPARADATDEVMVPELAARSEGWRVGDTLTLGTWRVSELDGAVNKALKPTLQLGTVRITGIARLDIELTPLTVDLIGSGLVWGGMIVGPGVANAYADKIAGYGYSVTLRLKGGSADAEAFTTSLGKRFPGWSLVDSGPNRILKVDALDRLLRIERQATWAATAILAITLAALVTLIASRRVRADLAEIDTLRALGLTRRDGARLALARGLSFAVPCVASCVAALVLGSALTPFATARRLEYHLGLRVDWVVVAVVAISVAMLLMVVATVVGFRAARLSDVAAHRSGRRVSRRGAVGLAGLSFVRNGAARTGVAAAAIALGAVVASGVVVGSADRLLAEPVRFGAWWDLTVGNFSDAATSAHAVTALRSNPLVDAAAGHIELGSGTINGRPFTAVVFQPVVGRPTPPMVRGRLPVASDEVALGLGPATVLGVGVGDTVAYAAASRPGGPLLKPRSVRVVGVAVSLVQIAGSAYDNLAYLPLPPGNDGYSTSFQVRVRPSVGRSRAIASLAPEFSSWMQPALPADDVRIMLTLRRVPWLLVALICVFGFAGVLFSLFAVLVMHRGQVRILGVLGMRARQARLVAATVGVWITGVACVFAIPLGTLVGRVGWRSLRIRAHLVSGPVAALPTIVVACVAAFAVVVGGAVLAGSRVGGRARFRADAAGRS